MTDVQNDMAWRHQMLTEVQPLDRPVASPTELKFVCRNPLSWNYNVEVASKASSSRSSSSTTQLRSRGSSSSSSYTASSRSKSSLRSSGYSSLSRARSSVLSTELENEKQIREAMEREVEELKAQLAKVDPSMMRPAGLGTQISKTPRSGSRWKRGGTRPCWAQESTASSR